MLGYIFAFALGFGFLFLLVAVAMLFAQGRAYKQQAAALQVTNGELNQKLTSYADIVSNVLSREEAFLKKPCYAHIQPEQLQVLANILLDYVKAESNKRVN